MVYRNTIVLSMEISYVYDNDIVSVHKEREGKMPNPFKYINEICPNYPVKGFTRRQRLVNREGSLRQGA